MKGCWVLSKAFSVFIERIMWFLSLLLFICCYIYGFTHVEPSLHPQNQSDLVMVYELFDMLLNPVCQYFVCSHSGECWSLCTVGSRPPSTREYWVAT
jgi:hypothetical protein